MPESVLEVSVCLCTYKRPDKLSDCLKSLVKQTFSRPFEVIVTDNDCHRSGEKVVHELKEAFQISGMPISYLVEPVQNIALARNRCVQAARGNLVAFIDDDERAASNWLENMHKTLIETNADGVWGPVIPDIPDAFPSWMRRSKLFDRPNMKDRSIMPTDALRTGNALIKASLLTLRAGPFNERFGRTGGEDTDLFAWLQRQDFKFVWAEYAEVFEKIAEKRRHLRWHMVRGYRGGWTYSYQLVGRYGWFVGFCLSTVRIIPSILRSFLYFIMNLSNIRAAIYLLARETSGHIGKIGFFFKIRIEEYKD